MPPAAAAVVPHPPLLLRELAGGAAAELDPLRSACRQALTAVLAAAGTTIVVGDGPVWGVPEPGARGSFRPYGADVQVTLPALVDLSLPGPRRPGQEPPHLAVPVDHVLPGLPAPARLTELPLSLAVAAHLLAGLDPPPARLIAVTVPAWLGPGAAAAIGRALAAAAPVPVGPTTPTPDGAGAGRLPAAVGGERAVGLVVMADLSACRSERAPGAFRPEAAGFDAAVAEAFRAGRPERLLDMDPNQAGELLVGGRVPLQVLAGALGNGPALRGQVLYEDAPYGVGYLVALLTSR
jgi:hypothetical protein